MLLILFSFALLALAALPALLIVRNVPQFKTIRGIPTSCSEASSEGTAASCEAGMQSNASTGPAISILIPARNEEAGIEASLRAILANDFKCFEVLVLDDASTDRTAAIVEQIAATDARVQLIKSLALPAGWNGKQHACWQLAQIATHDWLMFLDADVRLSNDSLARIAEELRSNPRELLSGFPKQVTGTFWEKLLIPLMHVVLLGYLPLDRMRTSRDPAFGAGCGQLFVASKSAYFACGGHQSICNSRHDGLKLPRCFRAAGFATDVFDAGDIAHCRMYHSASQVVSGLLKNANEGIAQPKLIAIFTVLLLGGQTLPIFAWAHALYWGWPIVPTLLLTIATALSYVPRVVTGWRFGQSWVGVVFHPIAVAVFVGLQWWAFIRSVTGLKPVAWRGRTG
jgi:hypothetical protein